jgi:20S proteasome subunit alpha 3
MARRYDTRTTIFSPEGRLYQVEYALEAISQAGTCLGIRTNEGILLLAEKRVVDKLLDSKVMREKIFKISSNVLCAVAGITADANVLIGKLREIAANYRSSYEDDIPIEQLVSILADYKQKYTQVGGKRPYGVSLLYAGWDIHHGFQLYQSDPSGNYTGWFATCVGKHQQTVVSHFKQESKDGVEDISLVEAKKLAFKILAKTMDRKMSVDFLEAAELKMVNGEFVMRFLPDDEVEGLIIEANAALLSGAQD